MEERDFTQLRAFIENHDIEVLEDTGDFITVVDYKDRPRSFKRLLSLAEMQEEFYDCMDQADTQDKDKDRELVEQDAAAHFLGRY
jgi:hypothetical protein